MNMLLIILGTILVCVGMGRIIVESSPIVPGTARSDVNPLPSHEEIVQRLTDAATKYAVHVHVFNTARREGDEDNYCALATKGKPFNFYIEDGAEDYWYVTNYKTQDVAAWALVQALELPPNSQPQHKDNRKRIQDESLSIAPAEEK
mgnify:CR=1 FL=1